MGAAPFEVAVPCDDALHLLLRPDGSVGRYARFDDARLTCPAKPRNSWLGRSTICTGIRTVAVALRSTSTVSRKFSSGLPSNQGALAVAMTLSPSSALIGIDAFAAQQLVEVVDNLLNTARSKRMSIWLMARRNR